MVFIFPDNGGTFLKGLTFFGFQFFLYGILKSAVNLQSFFTDPFSRRVYPLSKGIFDGAMLRGATLIFGEISLSWW